MKYFIANWKANKNLIESLQWIDAFLKVQHLNGRLNVVICPPLPHLLSIKQKLHNKPDIYLGVQDISMFESGSFTGEVTAKNLEGLATYALIGHSERRKYFNETDEIIQKKIKNAKRYNIEPILCVRDEKDFIPPDVRIIAYEPVYAIGSGSSEPVEKVLESKKKLNLPPDRIFLYGGSVDKNNISSYLKNPGIDGFLIGTASLDPVSFFDIASQA